jgi:hypothetical protein
VVGIFVAFFVRQGGYPAEILWRLRYDKILWR